ncbi:amidohydrolase [Halomarina oriensis]|uniref:Amidohydrolase family protein n=1 Tax=Halomarina oriensis TaxID=671145 RepID=A0A6B0GNM6_9EURY|nr:amidohydrolase [Halomarina oriensis]MWG35119.1 amidohydrolase family protein [Halomarina oriensis]
MTGPADLVLTNAEVHTLDSPAETHEALAVRDGEIVRLGDAYEVDFLVGAATDVLDCEGRVVLPGFVDAHTHLPMVGRRLVHADLSAADSPADATDLLRERAAETEDDAAVDGTAEWVQGFGYDESTWTDSRYLTRVDLDAVSETRPVVAFREDMHTAGLNSVALDRLAADMPTGDVRHEGGDPTGVVVEEAVDAVWEAVDPGVEETRELVRAARDFAHAHGVTGVHDMVRNSEAPRVYRELDAADELDLRVRINYWTDHLDSLVDLGARTNHGSEFVRVGGVKSFTDGSFGGRTAKLSEPYADAPAGGGAGDGDSDRTDADATGQWVVTPEALTEYVERADAAGLQFTAHAIGDEAIEAVLDAYAGVSAPAELRHRVEHAELLTDELVSRFAELGVVASVQPNFLKWARPGGLYDTRLGEDRARSTNRYRDLLDAGVRLAFGSDCMPLGPLFGVQQAVTAPADGQRLTVTEALRAYTSGAAYAGFDEDRLGTVRVGKRADLVVLEESPWTVAPDSIGDVEVTHTVVDGDVVFRRTDDA